MRKVLCYVVRDGTLLVFRHRDHPDAGLQVPAGTLHHAEAPETCAIREIEEETGRRGYRIVAKLGVYDYEFRHTFEEIERHELHERHVFHLEPPPGLPETWSHLADDEEGDFWFEFSWVDIGPDLVLAGGQHGYLDRLRPK